MQAVLLIALMFAAGERAEERVYLQAATEERAGRTAQAQMLFEQCAREKGDLARYAEVRALACAAKQGPRADAVAGYRAFLKAHGDAPWVGMAEAWLAQLLAEEKRHGEAAPHFMAVLRLDPEPWWLDRYAWPAIESLLAYPEGHAEGYAWLRDRVETATLGTPRLQAARRLMQSPEPADRAVAVIGMLRSNAYREAAEVLQQIAVSLRGPEGVELPVLLILPRLLDDKAPLADQRELSLKLAEANPDGPWTPLLLTCAMRVHAANRRFGRAESFCDVLVRHYPTSGEAGDALWWLANYQRDEGRHDAALALYGRLARDCPGHPRAPDALFQIGWRHYQSGQRREAEAAFLDLGKRYPDSAARVQGYYLAGRIRETAGDLRTARLYYVYAAHDAIGNYHAHRALNHLSTNEEVDEDTPVNLRVVGNESFLRPFPGKPEEPPEFPEHIEKDARARRLRFFGLHGLEEGEWEAVHLCRQLGDHRDADHWYRLVAEAGFAHTALRYANAHGWGLRHGRPTLDCVRLLFPRAYWPEICAQAREAEVDPYLLLAIARQESTFRASIVSHAGATGVMQIMPATGRWLADVDANIPVEYARNLESARHSIRLGAFYLRRMLRRSDNNIIFALVSYNAGPGNCDKWRKRYPNLGMEEFVEAIPFSETRDYLKKVLGNYAAYYSLYPPPPISCP